MAHVIVLAGGTSDEREVSLRSGEAVRKALEKAGHHAEIVDTADGLDTLLPQLKQADVIFPALHGQGGEDGVLQKFLEDNGIDYVGSDSQASALCFDKARYDELLRENNLSTPNTELVKYQEYLRSELRRKPFVLKPNDGGSSIDTFIVRDPAEADEITIKEAFGRHKILLLQSLIEGDEITIAILGDEPLPVIEIIPPEGAEFDYDNKYNGQTQELCPPMHVDINIQKKAQSLALQIHRLTGCRDMSRTDMIVTPSGELYVLETNTIPGLTDQSLLPKAAGEAGYDMPALCDKLVRLALARTNT
ncbi:MAG TPA: D-alanine--D-alanine ligase [Candidatus Saccharimonadales bacterium]|nr:D-alanine--D-alanine ligase [Candidatus Saccharimonadales bacterium]